MPNIKKSLKSKTRIRFHWGTSEIFGRIILLDKDELQPGETCIAQIRMESIFVGIPRTHFIIRSFSPVHTIGGGIIIDIFPPKRRRFKETDLKEIVIEASVIGREFAIDLLSAVLQRSVKEEIRIAEKEQIWIRLWEIILMPIGNLARLPILSKRRIKRWKY